MPIFFKRYVQNSGCMYFSYLDNKEGHLVHQRGWYAPLRPMAYSLLHQTSQTHSLSIWFQLCKPRHGRIFHTPSSS